MQENQQKISTRTDKGKPIEGERGTRGNQVIPSIEMVALQCVCGARSFYVHHLIQSPPTSHKLTVNTVETPIHYSKRRYGQSVNNIACFYQSLYSAILVNLHRVIGAFVHPWRWLMTGTHPSGHAGS